MSFSSVEKIKQLKQQVEQATGSSYADLTTAIQALKDGYGSSSGAGGIIDVTELPNADVVENAVYRLTENVQTNINEVYSVDYRGTKRTAAQLLANMGVPTIPNYYIVDELPSDMKASDVSTFTVLNAYILKTDGKVYFYVNGVGVITMGILVFQDTAYDKGSTDNVFEETEMGIYTTFETYKQVVRYFVRNNKEWEEITAVMSEDLPNGLTDVDVLNGIYQSEEIVTKSKTIDVKAIVKNDRIIPSKVSVDIPLMGDIIDPMCDIEEITLNDFYRSNGEKVYNLRNYAFCQMTKLKRVALPDGLYTIPTGCFSECHVIEHIQIPESVNVLHSRCFFGCISLKNIVIPANVNQIDGEAFENCSSLTTVTFKGTPNVIQTDSFFGAEVQTINVPWAEGEVSGAPWGARTATINYNYTGG